METQNSCPMDFYSFSPIVMDLSAKIHNSFAFAHLNCGLKVFSLLVT